MQFQVDGRVEGDAVIGTCLSDVGGVYFEAQLRGDQLSLVLIEPGANNMPDYSKARQLILNRQGGGIPSEHLTVPQTATYSEVAANEVGDPSWGFKFRPPEGWKSQKGDRVAILGHGTVAGDILVLPHMATSFQEAQQQMLEGISEEGTHLSLTGTLRPLADNVLTGDYEGAYGGQRVKARGIGNLSPHGGGAFIIALAIPEKFSQELSNAAEEIARGIQYLKVEASDLIQHFAGTWVSFTRDTETRVTLTPSGDFFQNYEASHMGQFRNQYGDQTG